MQAEHYDLVRFIEQQLYEMFKANFLSIMIDIWVCLGQICHHNTSQKFESP